MVGAPARLRPASRAKFRELQAFFDGEDDPTLAQGDWVDLGSADEQKPAKDGTVEAWGRSESNPVGGWYGLRKSYRGRFGMYLPPLLEKLGLTVHEHFDCLRWPGEAGKRVFASVGKPAWQRWLAHQTMLINENRLSPLNPQHRALLEGEMLKFLFGGGAEKPAGYVPTDA